MSEDTEVFISEKRRAAFRRFVARIQATAQEEVNEEIATIREDYAVDAAWFFDADKGRFYNPKSPVPASPASKKKP